MKKNNNKTAKIKTANKKGLFEPIINIFRKIYKLIEPIILFFKKIFKYIGKLFEKNDLVKWISVILFLSVIFTWIFKMRLDVENYAYWRIGLLDFFNVGAMGLELEPRKTLTLFTFIVVVAFFYEILKRTNSYKLIVEKVTKKLSKHGLFFILCTIFFFAIISSLFSDPLIAFFFVPFFITIILNLKYDKVTAFLATFGGILSGIIGSIYSGKIFGELSAALGIGYQEDIIIYRFILLIVSMILVTIFTLFRIKKSATKDKDLNSKQYNEMFEVDKPTKKEKKLLTPILLVLLSIFIIMASIPWKTAFGSTWPAEFHQWFNELTVFNFPLFENLTGYSVELGVWDIYGIQSIILVTIVVIALLSKMKFTDFIDSIVESFKKMSKPLLILFLINFVRSVNAFFPAIRTIFIAMMKEFNYFIAAIIGFFSSIFGVDVQISWLLSGEDMMASFSANIAKDKFSIITQSVYGLSQFVSPTSIFLMLGLSLLEIPFIKWLKKTWALSLGLLFLVVTVILVVTQL